MKKKAAALLSFGALVALAVSAGPASGTGNGAPSGSHYTLNIIGVDKGKKPPMDGSNRHVIFVPTEGGCRIGLVVGDFNVNDGNCFDGDGAEFQLPNPDADGDGTTAYSVFARALGTPGGSSTTTACATNPATGKEVCSVISLELTRDAGQTQFQNASKYLLYIYADYDEDGDADRLSLFDDRLQDYFWGYDNDGLKLAQLRFYDCATTVPGADDPTGPQTSTC